MILAFGGLTPPSRSKRDGGGDGTPGMFEEMLSITISILIGRPEKTDR